MNNLAPILQQLNGNQTSQALQALMPQIRMARQSLQALNAMQNPQQALQQMIQSNPQYGEALKVLNNYNGDINGAINALCAQRGIDPNAFMQALNGGF